MKSGKLVKQIGLGVMGILLLAGFQNCGQARISGGEADQPLVRENLLPPNPLYSAELIYTAKSNAVVPGTPTKNLRVQIGSMDSNRNSLVDIDNGGCRVGGLISETTRAEVFALINSSQTGIRSTTTADLIAAGSIERELEIRNVVVSNYSLGLSTRQNQVLSKGTEISTWFETLASKLQMTVANCVAPSSSYGVIKYSHKIIATGVSVDKSMEIVDEVSRLKVTFSVGKCFSKIYVDRSYLIRLSNLIRESNKYLVKASGVIKENMEITAQDRFSNSLELYSLLYSSNSSYHVLSQSVEIQKIIQELLSMPANNLVCPSTL